MAQITIPFRPQPGDPEDITEILADFDAILDQANGSLQASVNVEVATAVTNDGNANAEGSASGLARADHRHLIQGVERRTGDPASGHFVGRLYFNTTTERLRLCVDTGAPLYVDLLDLQTAAGGTYAAVGAVPYVVAGPAPAWTAAPTDGQILRSLGAVPTWVKNPAVRVRGASAQVVADATDTILNFDTEDFDYGGYHDNATNNSRLTVPAGQAGVYRIVASVQFAADADGVRILRILKNGSTIASEPVITQNALTGGNAHGMDKTTLLDLVATDYVEIQVRHNAGNNLNVTGLFMLERVS